MRLADALRFGDAPVVALVGAGGKTSALFCLARELLALRRAREGEHSVEAGVLVTTTTHLCRQQARLANHHYVISSDEEMLAAVHSPWQGVVLFTGPETEEERLVGLDKHSLARLYKLAMERRLPLLIEADGARRRALKAPAAHEPAIPPWIDTVVVVAGLTALGKPLSEEWVHRPQIFGLLSGLREGEIITAEALAKVLTHPQGGLKNIPRGARRVALLNQIDDEALQAEGETLAGHLLSCYAAVVLSHLAAGSEGESPALAVYEPIAAVVLAAGASRRLGRPKPLMLWKGKPFIWHVCQSALQAGLSPLIVVLGYAAEEVAQAVAEFSPQLVVNSLWPQGQGTSVAAGVRALPPTVGGAIFLLVDQPHLPPSLLSRLVEKHAQTLAPIVVPFVNGRRGNPALFDRVTFGALQSLIGEVGGRALFGRFGITEVPWADETILLDVDSDEDYQHLLRLS